MRLSPRGVNRHHPNRLFARVINAISRSAQAGELQQAEFSRPTDGRAAVLNAELAVHGALVGLHGI